MIAENVSIINDYLCVSESSTILRLHRDTIMKILHYTYGNVFRILIYFFGHLDSKEEISFRDVEAGKQAFEEIKQWYINKQPLQENL